MNNAGINPASNFIFGLPGDDLETMKKTLDLGKELCTSGWNGYAAMALPGSQLYKDAIEKKYKLPENFEGYSFHAYNTVPLPTEKLPAYKILEFRDKAFIEYHSNENFLKRIKDKFGIQAVNSIKEMLKIKLKRFKRIYSSKGPISVTTIEREKEKGKTSRELKSKHKIIKKIGSKSSIYCSPGHFVGFHPITKDEIKLKKYLFNHQVKRKFQYSLEWKKNQLAIWDNRSMLHQATPFKGNRIMHRITIQ